MGKRGKQTIYVWGQLAPGTEVLRRDSIPPGVDTDTPPGVEEKSCCQRVDEKLDCWRESKHYHQGGEAGGNQGGEVGSEHRSSRCVRRPLSYLVPYQGRVNHRVFISSEVQTGFVFDKIPWLCVADAMLNTRGSIHRRE